MNRTVLPRQPDPLVDKTGRTTIPFYLWMQAVERAFGTTDPATIEALRQDIEQLRQEIANLPSGDLIVHGLDSIVSIGPQADGSYALRLVNDQDSPGAFYVYGADETGEKGWRTLADVVNVGPSLEKATDWGDWNYLGELASVDDLPGSGTLNDAYVINGNVWVWDSIAWVDMGLPPGGLVIALVNDEATPDPLHYYGTDAEGVRGYHALPEPVPGFVPYFIPADTTFTVPLYSQALFTMPIDAEGLLVVDGFLVEVS